MSEQIEQAMYLYALKLLDISHLSVVKIAQTFPQLRVLPRFSLRELQEMLGPFQIRQKKKAGLSLAEQLYQGLNTHWEKALVAAEDAMNQHIERHISPIPITSDEYPVLLKLIKDPPPILYVKGDKAILNHLPTVAIIGTREATAYGLRTTHTIAYECARRGCVIVSGLAKGTDTSAHRGAIEVNGKTIAVLATPLDKVYPAENKKLADKICQESGALVSEYPIGTVTHKGAFIARDRIQSGISLGVIPIQTDIDGGTMHTVRSAREYNRPIFCPPPPEEEKQHDKYRGITYLLKQAEEDKHVDKKKRIINPFPFNSPGIYERFVERLEEQRHTLLEMQEEQVPLSVSTQTA